MMADAKMELQVERLIRIIRKYDLDISGYDPFFLNRSLERRLQTIQCESPSIYFLILEQNAIEAKTFYHGLRVGYSAFFRDPMTFALLEQRILPELIDQHEKKGHTGLRIWSAGCSSGQEAWSIAILLDEFCATKPHLNWRIFATDIDEPDLENARAGIYSANEVGNIRLRHLETAFQKRDAYYVIEQRLRNRIEFSTYDLLDATTSSPPNSIFGDFDLILCCNVLLYYRPEQQRQILAKLMQGLAPSGYFVTGETERQLVSRESHMHEVTPSVPVFRRR